MIRTLTSWLMRRVFGYSHDDVNVWRDAVHRHAAVTEAARELHDAFLKVDHETLAVTMNRQWARLHCALDGVLPIGTDQ